MFRYVSVCFGMRRVFGWVWVRVPIFHFPTHPIPRLIKGRWSTFPYIPPRVGRCGKLKNFIFHPFIHPMSKVCKTMSFVCFDTLAIIWPLVYIFHFPTHLIPRLIKGRWSTFPYIPPRVVRCGKWNFEKSQFLQLPFFLIQITCFGVLSSSPPLDRFGSIWVWVKIFTIPLYNFSFSHRSLPINFEEAMCTKVIR